MVLLFKEHKQVSRTPLEPLGNNTNNCNNMKYYISLCSYVCIMYVKKQKQTKRNLLD